MQVKTTFRLRSLGIAWYVAYNALITKRVLWLLANIIRDQPENAGRVKIGESARHSTGNSNNR